MMKAKPSATTLNSAGAEHNPKGSAVSTYSSSPRTIPNRLRSSGCTGICLYAAYRSNLAIRAPLSLCRTLAVTSSTVVYDTVHNSFAMPSFTLLPLGDDRRRHLPGSYFGMTPKGLTWIHGNASGLSNLSTSLLPDIVRPHLGAV